MPSTSDSISLLRFRSWIAVGLVLGFYILSISVSIGLLFFAYEAVTHLSSFGVNLKIALFCVIGAGTILWSILPRFERFEPPGPEIAATSEPRLFQEIRQIAEQCNQPVPHDVYLTGEMNAGVLQHGGFLGKGSRSVMIVGLPLICSTTVSQFRAILAHEFGHFYGGDTKLAPWIYKTTKAIIRTLTSLAQRKSHLTFLFQWYGLFFLRITRSISRHQEFAADALGARLAGSTAMQEGLRATIPFDLVSQVYWQSEVLPVLKSGFRPSLAAGFTQFTASAWCKELVKTPETESVEKDIYDTHPPLQERIQALKGLPPSDAPMRDSPAITLFDHLDEQEERLISFFQDAPAKLQAIAWEDVGKQVYVPEWTRKVQQNANALSGITPASLANIRGLNEFWDKFRDPPGMLLAREQRERFGLACLGSALALGLYQRGWQLCAVPGKMELQENGITISPFQTVFKLASREISPENWLEQCAKAEISQIDLSQLSVGSTAAGQ
jgi:Zn-dependent protease with chaperone function